MAGNLINIGGQNIPAMWNINAVGLKAVRAVNESNNQAGVIRNFSSLPMKCKGKDFCIYGATCFMDTLKVKTEDFVGQVCPIEVELILNLFDSYVKEFDLKELEDKKNTTIIGLLKDLIDTELQIERANKRLMLDGEYLEDRVVGVSEATGEVLTNKEVNQHIMFKERMRERKAKILNLLNATPKDKADKTSKDFSPDQYAAEILKKAKELNMVSDAGEIKDVEFVPEPDGDDNGSKKDSQ
jgi:hypothetical protein